MADVDSRAGVSYATPAILEWVAGVHAPEDGPLRAAFDAPGRHGMPAIQLGSSEARLLELLLRLVGARNVVEVGTLAGFSALRMARALPADGRLHTIEFDPAHAAVARENVARAGEASRVVVHEGAAAEVLPRLAPKGPFDAVFLDADKAGYAAYGRWAAANVRRGGLLLADNVFLFGRLLDGGAEAESMRRFHEEARGAFDTVCIPTPDGLLVGVRT